MGEDDEQLTNLIERLEDGNEVINNLSSQEEFGEARLNFFEIILRMGF